MQLPNLKKSYRMRIDLFLYEKGFAKSRTHAANLIKLNRILKNGVLVTKPSLEIEATDSVEVLEEESFYSLGGCKLQRAIDAFHIDLKEKIALDAGCANGGFTGVILNCGAKFVYAVDVGENALPQDLQRNPSVLFLRQNIKNLTKDAFHDEIDFISADLSFISLTKVLNIFYELLKDGGEGVFLIKPQFEAGKAFLSKTGIVTDEKVRRRVVKNVIDFAESVGFRILGLTEAPHPFQKKNQEYLLYCKR